MTRGTREPSGAVLLCMILMLLPLSGCDGGKPPEPVAPKPVATAPPQVAKPATAASAPVQPSAKQISDAALAARVKAALDAEPQIHGFAIDVTADNGKVALFGTVHTKARRDKAGQIAKGVSGVKSVDNNLAIVAGS